MAAEVGAGGAGGGSPARRLSATPLPSDARWVGYGEAMLRFAPLGTGESMHGRGQPSARSEFMRSVGGDELNVMVRRVAARSSARVCARVRLPRADTALPAEPAQRVGLPAVTRPGCRLDAWMGHGVGIGAAVRAAWCAARAAPATPPV